MRRILITLLSVMTAIGCTGSRTAEDKPQIFVSITPLRVLAEEITGEDFDIEVLVPAGASPESFEPTPRQFIALNKARIVFAVGLLDFERTLLSKLSDNEKVVDLSRGIELISGSCSHSHGTHCHGIDPHIWSSPKALKIMAGNAFEAICKAFPDSTKYERRYSALCEKLDTLDRHVAEICNSAECRHFVIYHPALTYLARDYGLEQTAIEHEGKEPGAKRLASIIERARKDGVRRIFYQAQFPASVVQTVAKDIEAEPAEIDPLAADLFANIEHMTRLITGNE